MFNINEIEYYRTFTIDVFNQLNGIINKTCNVATLEICGECYINDLYGEIEFPNNIKVYLITILKDYDTYDLRCSMIMYTIIHELSHIDLSMNLVTYSTNNNYCEDIENMTDSNANRFIEENKLFLENWFHFKFVLSDTWLRKGKYYNYIRTDLYKFYLQTLVNIVHRNLNTISMVKYIFDNYETISVEFNNEGKSYIKTNGIFIQNDLSKFTSDIIKYCNPYTVYTLSMNMQYIDNTICHISYTMKDLINEPILYCG